MGHELPEGACVPKGRQCLAGGVSPRKALSRSKSPNGAKEAPVSYTNLNYQIVFATKERRRWLRAELRQRLFQYLGDIVGNLGGSLVAANGPEDHIHLAVVAAPILALSGFVQKVKANSSRWIHADFPKLVEFAWQDGYAAFSVSRSVLPRVVRYIEGQEAHHKTLSFKEELTTLLKKHGVAYDERYVG